LNAIISSNAQTIQIYHNGGDSLSSGNIQILLNGQDFTTAFMENGATGWSTWSVGQSLTYNIPPGTPVPSSIQIVYKGGGVSQVIAASGQGSTGSLSVPAPGVTGITPNTGIVGHTVHITNLAGSNFFNGASVTFINAGYGTVTASNVSVVSATQITCDFNIPNSQEGTWDVVVTNPNGPSGTLINGFTTFAALAPVVAFSGTPLSGTVPLTVSFTDSSANFPTSWLWTFGDGNRSYSQNPVYTYQIPGTYNVSLTATNTAGSGNLTKTNYITVNPIVTYTINATATPPGGSISPSGTVIVLLGNNQAFTISPDTGYSIADVLVDGVSNGTISSYTFTNVAANHTINATFAINQYTINATSGANGTVTPAGLTLVNYGSSQTYNITPNIGYNVADVEVNNASVGSVTTYQFTNVNANQTISATFAINQYTITPSISGGNGTISPNTVQTVNYGDTPTFNFTPNSGYHLNTVTVNGSLVTPTGNSYTFPPVTTNQTIVGTFLVNPPVANFTGTPRTGAIPLAVTFTDISTNNPTSWLWNFGDGNTSTAQNPTNTYVAAGNYSVQLTATNAGGSNTSLQNGYIFAYIPAVANFTANVTTGPNPLTVQFTDLSTGSPYNWYWQFGDTYIVNTSTAQNPVHTYQTVGIYSVNLTVSNTYSSSYLNRTNYINDTTPPPIARIYANVTSGVAPLAVSFTDLSGNSPTSWLWSFGDGSANVTTQDATHTFASAGSYNVSLTATNAGGSSTAYKMINVYVPPTFTSIAPTTGPLAGGTPVTIIGTNLIGATTSGIYNVSIGGTALTNMTVVSNTTIIGSTLAHAAGAVNVVITTPNGTVTGTGAYTYESPPTFTSIAPSTGPVSVSTPITIIGTNLIGATNSGSSLYNVSIGGTAMTNMTVVSSTTIIGSTPANATAGAVNVVITTPNGTATGPNAYTYVAAPAFTSITPATGPLVGGTPITIIGTNLIGATNSGSSIYNVSIGGTAITNMTVVSSTTIIGSTLAHAAGAVNVVITTPNGTATGTGAYTYVAAPTFTSITPTTGPVSVSTPITIIGTNLIGATNSGSSIYNVSIGGTALTNMTVVSSTTIIGSTPANATAGAVNVVITTPNGTATGPSAYTYVTAPTFTSITPTYGPLSGSTPITIIGTNLIGATNSGSSIYNVSIGGTAITNMTVVSSTTIIGSTLAHAAGAVNVVITTPNGTATGPNAYTYVTAPAFTSITPATGPLVGGTPITIIGTNLIGATNSGSSIYNVSIGGTAITNMTVVSSTTIIGSTLAHAAGAVNVVITTPNGTVTGTGAYTYVAAPTITSISPTYGVQAFGTRVNITGTNLVGANAGGLYNVTFGSNLATINANTATTINMTAPAGSSNNTVTVTVATPNGTATILYNYFNVTTFTATQAGGWPVPTNVSAIQYLVVAGGGGGGRYGGGGGAGGVLSGTLTSGLSGSLTVTVGAGGTGATTNAVGGSGGNSVFATITATGGGGGGSSGATVGSGGRTGGNGGSGGGGSRSTYLGGTATPAGQGYAGGWGNTTTGGNYLGGGGGGGGATGGAANTTVAGNGGAGTTSTITGAAVTYAGGGGGGAYTGNTAGSGGAGGGGAGSNSGTGTAGTANTGGGGGGGNSAPGSGGNGGTGIIIIRYW
jgi:PKD repeat protein